VSPGGARNDKKLSGPSREDVGNACDRRFHVLSYDALMLSTNLHRFAMKRLLVFGVLLCAVGLSSCQCSDKPDVGPTEEEEKHALEAPTRSVPASLRA